MSRSESAGEPREQQPPAGEGDTARHGEAGLSSPGKETETDWLAQHDDRQEAGSQPRDDSTAIEHAGPLGRGDYADSLRAQNPWQASTGAQESASTPERQDQPAGRAGTARMEDTGTTRTDFSGGDQTDDAAARTGQSPGDRADTPDDQPSGQDPPSSEQPAESNHHQVDYARPPDPGEPGTTTGRQEDEGPPEVGSSADLTGQTDETSREDRAGALTERPAEASQAGQPGDGTRSTDAPPSQATSRTGHRATPAICPPPASTWSTWKRMGHLNSTNFAMS